MTQEICSTKMIESNHIENETEMVEHLKKDQVIESVNEVQLDTVETNTMNVKVDSDELNFGSIKKMIKVEADDLISNLSQPPSHKVINQEIEEDIDIVIGNSEFGNNDVEEEMREQDHFENTFGEIDIEDLKDTHVKSNKCFSKTVDNIGMKCRSKSESIQRENIQKEDPIRNIQIKEGDFCSDLHKSYQTNSVNEKKQKNERAQYISNNSVPRKEQTKNFIQKNQSKSELNCTPGQNRKQSFSNIESE
jgi:hypothetical protein